MVIRGKVENGVVIFPDGVSLPDGTEVTVYAPDSADAPMRRESTDNEPTEESSVDLGANASRVPAHALPYEEWRRAFHSWINSRRSRNPHFDDSRDSIYD
jgi:hypothetical protein